MKVTIIGINFKHSNGYDKEYTSVELQYIASGFKVNDNNPVEITKEQYEQNKSNSNGLRALIVDKKIVEAGDYIDGLQTYKENLTVE